MVAAPIEVSGQLWGAVVVTLTGDRRSPPTRIVQLGTSSRRARERGGAGARSRRAGALSRVAVAVATEEERGAACEEAVRRDRASLAHAIVGGWHNADGRRPAATASASSGGGAESGYPARHARATARRCRSRRSSSPGGSGSDLDPIPAPYRAPDAEKATSSPSPCKRGGDRGAHSLPPIIGDGRRASSGTCTTARSSVSSRPSAQAGALRDEPAAAQELLEASSAELAAALEELRELARGLHPAILSDRGLGAALEALATRALLPVELDGVLPERLPPPVEAAAYYVVAESLTNVARYAEASTARVSVVQDNGFAIVEVVDDGVGGVDVSRGSGLRGSRTASRHWTVPDGVERGGPRHADPGGDPMPGPDRRRPSQLPRQREALLVSEGYEVIGEAETGAEAVQLARSCNPTSSCSTSLPDLNGFEVTALLRELDEPPDVVLVLEPRRLRGSGRRNRCARVPAQGRALRQGAR